MVMIMGMVVAAVSPLRSGLVNRRLRRQRHGNTHALTGQETYCLFSLEIVISIRMTGAWFFFVETGLATRRKGRLA